MRGIKFRAWDKELKGWLQAFVVAEDGKVYEPSCRNEWTDNVDITQYTGFLDRHNKEIYDGDIISFKRRDGLTDAIFNPFTGSEPLDVVSEVFYQNGAYLVNIKNRYDLSLFEINPYSFFDVEIIGNVYENPELIK